MKITNKTDTYPFDADELHRRFPADIPVPDLLLAFGQWMKTMPYGSIGDIYFDTENPDHIAGPEAHHQIIKIMDEDDIYAFFWRHDTVGETLPIVLIDGDGSIETIPSLTAFLARFALGYYSADSYDRNFFYNLAPECVYIEQDFEDHDDPRRLKAHKKELAKLPPDLRSELGLWLLDYTNADRLEELLDVGPPPPSFDTWVTDLEIGLNKNLNAHPSVKAIAQAIKERDVTIIWIGEFYRAYTREDGRHGTSFRILEEADEIKPHVQALREDWAKDYPGLGLWQSASFKKSISVFNIIPVAESYFDDRSIFEKLKDLIKRTEKPSILEKAGLGEIAKRYVSPILRHEFHYDYIVPKVLGDNLPETADFKADQTRYPRAPHRISPWLKARLFSKV